MRQPCDGVRAHARRVHGGRNDAAVEALPVDAVVLVGHAREAELGSRDGVAAGVEVELCGAGKRLDSFLLGAADRREQYTYGRCLQQTLW